MTMRAILGFVACGVLLCGCGGGGGKSTGKKKKGKKSSGSSSAKKVLQELSVWAEDNAKDWPGFKKRLAEARKKLKGDKKATAKLKAYYTKHKEFVAGVLENTVKTLAANARKEGNEQYWQKNLKRFDLLEQQMRDYDEKFAAQHRETLNKERLFLISSQFETEVRKYVRAHRTEIDKVQKRVDLWRKQVAVLGDAGADLVKELDAIEAGSKTLVDWMKKTPPGGAVDLLDPKYRSGWKTIQNVKATWEGNEVTLEGTGSDKKDFGVLLHQAFWWTDFQIEMTFEVLDKGFTVLGRGHPPRSGVNQRVRATTFASGRPWRLTITIQGDKMTLGGDIEERSYKAPGEGGGVGFYLGPGDKAHILMFQVTAK